MNPFYLLQITAAPDSASVVSAPAGISLWDLTVMGGPVMIPIGICSVIAIYIIIERFLVMRKFSADSSFFLNTIRDYIRSSNQDAAKALCRNTPTPVARIIEKGLNKSGKPIADVEKAMENSASVEVANMEKGLSALSICAGAAPLLGFLGTVIGMVQAFYDMKMEHDLTHGNIDIGVLSEGMYQALVTTVAGLIVGIIALVCYNIIVGMIKNTTHKIEVASNEFLELLHG